MVRRSFGVVADHTVALRLDSAGDVLLSGPALRALAETSQRLTLVVSSRGADVAALLPGVDDIIAWDAPWIVPDRTHVSAVDIDDFVARIRDAAPDRAVIFTSYHQSALPTALLLRLAGVHHISAISEDYAGGLLDVRHAREGDCHEVEAMLSLARAAGGSLPAHDDGRLRIREPMAPLPVGLERLERGGFVVLHPGTSVPARAWPAGRWRQLSDTLREIGHDVVVTGAPHEQGLTGRVAANGARDLGGRTTWAQLATVFSHATAVVVANTGPAHLAAAVGAPVVSLFAPTVPPQRWAPYGVPTVLLGDGDAACRDTRATVCSTPGHPCLSSVTAADVVRALQVLERGAA